MPNGIGYKKEGIRMNEKNARKKILSMSLVMIMLISSFAGMINFIADQSEAANWKTTLIHDGTTTVQTGTLQVGDVPTQSGSAANDGVIDTVLAQGNNIIVKRPSGSPTSWTTVATITVPYAIYAVAIGDGNNDGQNEIYVGLYGRERDGLVIQIKWTGSAWQQTVVGVGAGGPNGWGTSTSYRLVYALAVGDPDNRNPPATGPNNVAIGVWYTPTSGTAGLRIASWTGSSWTSAQLSGIHYWVDIAIGDFDAVRNGNEMVTATYYGGGSPYGITEWYYITSWNSYQINSGYYWRAVAIGDFDDTQSGNEVAAANVYYYKASGFRGSSTAGYTETVLVQASDTYYSSPYFTDIAIGNFDPTVGGNEVFTVCYYYSGGYRGEAWRARIGSGPTVIKERAYYDASSYLLAAAVGNADPNRPNEEGVVGEGPTAYDTILIWVSPYGGSLSPPSQKKPGAPGTTVKYTLTLKNEGLYTDTFDLSYTPGALNWNVEFWNNAETAQISSITLASGASEDFKVYHIVPGSATQGQADEPTIRATSQGDNSMVATATIRTLIPKNIGWDILFVDDDNAVGGWGGQNINTRYETALDDAGYYYTKITTNNAESGITYDTLKDYAVVLWSIGNQYYQNGNGPLSASERAEIETYLDNGGSLGFFGGLASYGFNWWGGSAFMRERFGATYVTYTYGGYTHNRYDAGGGTYNKIATTPNTMSSFSSYNDQEASGVWDYQTHTTAGQSSDGNNPFPPGAYRQSGRTDYSVVTKQRGTGDGTVYRTVLFDIEFGEIGLGNGVDNGPTTRRKLMENIVEWLHIWPPPYRFTLSPSYKVDGTGYIGKTLNYQYTIKNTGNNTDLYNLTPINGNYGWEITLWNEQNTARLTDTNGDGVIDTGNVTRGSSFKFTVRHKIPSSAVLQMQENGTVKVVSYNNGSLIRNATFRTSVAFMFESFESAFPPTGWSNVAVSGSMVWARATQTQPTWQTPSGLPYDGNYLAFYDNYNNWASGQSARLSTPTINLALYREAWFEFAFWHTNYYSWDTTSRMDVEVSTDGGSSWTTLQTIRVNDGGGVRWKVYTFDLNSSIGQSNFKIGFRAYSDYYMDQHIDWFWLKGVPVELIFTEIWDNLSTYEYLELYNPLSDPVDLANYTLMIDSTNISMSGIVNSNEYKLLNLTEMGYTDILNDERGILRLYNIENILVDIVGYGYYGIAPDPLNGESTARYYSGGYYTSIWNRDETPTPNATNDVPGRNLTSLVWLNDIAINPYWGEGNWLGNSYIELYYKKITRPSYQFWVGDYSWIDISTNGTATGLNGDDSYTSIPLGFDFNFYGITFTEGTNLYIGTNGMMSFSSAGMTVWSNVGIPNTAAPNNLFAVVWDDLFGFTANNANVYYKTFGTSPNRYMVIQWYHWSWYYDPDSDTIEFEVILYENGTIRMQYNDMTSNHGRDNGADATSGIENSDGTVGLQYSYNNAILTAGKSVWYYLPSAPLESVDISNWKIVCDSVYTFPTPTIIGGDSQGGENSTYYKRYLTLNETSYPAGFDMDKEGDNIYLYNETGYLVDMVGWSSQHIYNRTVARIPDGNGDTKGYNDSTSKANGWIFDYKRTWNFTNNNKKPGIPTPISPVGQTIEVSQASPVGGFRFGGSQQATDMLAQTFKAVGNTITNARIAAWQLQVLYPWYASTETPYPNLYIYITEDYNGQPDFSRILASRWVPASTFGSAWPPNANWAYLNPSFPIGVEIGKKYWLVVAEDYDQLDPVPEGQLGIVFRGGNYYPDGEIYLSMDDGESFQAFGYDMAFTIYFGDILPAYENATLNWTTTTDPDGDYVYYEWYVGEEFIPTATLYTWTGGYIYDNVWGNHTETITYRDSIYAEGETPELRLNKNYYWRVRATDTWSPGDLTLPQNFLSLAPYGVEIPSNLNARGRAETDAWYELRVQSKGASDDSYTISVSNNNHTSITFYDTDKRTVLTSNTGTVKKAQAKIIWIKARIPNGNVDDFYVATITLTSVGNSSISDTVNLTTRIPNPILIVDDSGRSYTAQTVGYSWTDISSVGTEITQWRSTSQGYATSGVPIGFTFPFFGGKYNYINPSTEGHLRFGYQRNNSYTTSPNEWPPTSSPNPTYFTQQQYLFMFGQNMIYQSGTTRVWYYYDGSKFILQYNNLRYADYSQYQTFQVYLYPNGTIIVNYNSLDINSNAIPYVGIESWDVDRGFSYYPDLRSGMSIMYKPADILSYYTNALSANGYTYDVWTTGYYLSSNNPKFDEVLRAYDVVIWTTGLDRIGTFSALNEKEVAQYLGNGGRFFFVSQDYLREREQFTDFDSNYLHVATYTETRGSQEKAVSPGPVIDNITGVSGDPITDLMNTMNLTKWSTDYFDTLTPDSLGFETIVSNPAVGIRHASVWKVVFMSVPYEFISYATDRNDLMNRIIKYLAPKNNDTAVLDIDAPTLIDDDSTPTTINATIGNVGKLNQYNVPVLITITDPDGLTVDTVEGNLRTIPSLNKFSSTILTWTINWSDIRIKYGIYTITVETQLSGDEDLDNNLMSVNIFSSVLKNDIGVEELRTPFVVNRGTVVTVNALIKNYGSKDQPSPEQGSSTFEVKGTVVDPDGIVLYYPLIQPSVYQSVSFLASGNTTLLTWRFTASKWGVYRVTIETKLNIDDRIINNIQTTEVYSMYKYFEDDLNYPSAGGDLPTEPNHWNGWSGSGTAQDEWEHGTPVEMNPGGPGTPQYLIKKVPFNWIDGVTGGTRITSWTGGGNYGDGYKTVDLPFNFTYYGIEYSQAYISQNGHVAFSTPTNDWGYNTEIPNTGYVQNMIAGWWDDLWSRPAFYYEATGWIYYKYVADPTVGEMFVITWKDVETEEYSGTTYTITFEIVLYKNGNILVNYLDGTTFTGRGDNEGRSATAGVENRTGTRGTQYSYNQPMLTSGTSLLYSWYDGSKPSYSMPYSIGTDLDNTYNNNADNYLVSKPIDLRNASTAYISFMHWYQFQNGVDGGVVEISTSNDGITGWSAWQKITPTTGYPGTASTFGVGYTAYTFRSDGWERALFNIDGFIEKFIKIRWRMKSDGSIVDAGWYIDDVLVFGIPRLPNDLGVIDIITENALSPGEKIRVGDPISINATIKNIGLNDAFDFNVTILITDSLGEEVWGPNTDPTNTTQIITYLANNTTMVVTWTWAAVLADTYNITIFITYYLDEYLANNNKTIQQLIANLYFFILDRDEGLTESGKGTEWYIWDALYNGLGYKTILISREGEPLGNYNLRLFDVVFVLLGIYGDLTTSEQQQLEQFLQNGGRLYIEGADIAKDYYYGGNQIIFPYLDAQYVANGGRINTAVTGVSGNPITNGLSYSYTTNPNFKSIDQIDTDGGALMFEAGDTSPPPGLGRAVNTYNSTYRYRSVYMSILFAGLKDGSFPNTKANLMEKILRFFGITPPTVTVLTPNGGEYWAGTQVISWNATDDDIPPSQWANLTITIKYSVDGNWATATILYKNIRNEGGSGPSTGTKLWNTIGYKESGNARIMVIVNDGTVTRSDTSDNPFWVDNTEPETNISADEPSHWGSLYLRNTTAFYLNGTDYYTPLGYGRGPSEIGGSGIKETRYRIIGLTDWVLHDGSPLVPASLGMLDNTGYDIEYYSIDKAGNREDTKYYSIYIDERPPTSEIIPGDPNFGRNPTYVRNFTQFELIANDNYPLGGSGVYRIYYKVDTTGNWVEYTGPFDIRDAILNSWGTPYNDTHNNRYYTIYYRAEDNVENMELENSRWIFVQEQPPKTTITNISWYSDENMILLVGYLLYNPITELYDKYNAQGILIEQNIVDPFEFWFIYRFRVDFTAVDLYSGVKEIRFNFDNQGWTIVSASFAYIIIAPESPNYNILSEFKDLRLEYYAISNVDNEELPHNVHDNVKMDLIKPEIDLTLPDLGAPGGLIQILGTAYQILGTAQDTFFEYYTLEFRNPNTGGWRFVENGTYNTSKLNDILVEWNTVIITLTYGEGLLNLYDIRLRVYDEARVFVNGRYNNTCNYTDFSEESETNVEIDNSRLGQGQPYGVEEYGGQRIRFLVFYSIAGQEITLTVVIRNTGLIDIDWIILHFYDAHEGAPLVPDVYWDGDGDGNPDGRGPRIARIVAGNRPDATEYIGDVMEPEEIWTFTYRYEVPRASDHHFFYYLDTAAGELYTNVPDDPETIFVSVKTSTVTSFAPTILSIALVLGIVSAVVALVKKKKGKRKK